MSETITPLVIIEPIDSIDNETVELKFKCENFSLIIMFTNDYFFKIVSRNRIVVSTSAC